MEKQVARRGSTAAIAKIVRMGHSIKIKEMSLLADKAKRAGGALVAVAADGDEECGNGRFIFRTWPPPKPDLFVEFLDQLVQKHINFEVLINGIEPPWELEVLVDRELTERFMPH